MPSLVVLGFHPPPGRPKTLIYFGLFVCLFVTLLNVRYCAPDFAMKALEYRNDFDGLWIGKGLYTVSQKGATLTIWL